MSTELHIPKIIPTHGKVDTNMLIILVPKKIVDCFNPPVKTCGPPRIDDAVMSNMTVKPGQKVVFNCKVKFHKGRNPRKKHLIFEIPSLK